jgi:hypothetical protein
VILETKPKERKSITKIYPDGRTLTLLVIDDKLVEKSLTFCWDWNYELIREEKERGKTVSFKFWKKGELEVGLSYFLALSFLAKCSFSVSLKSRPLTLLPTVGVMNCYTTLPFRWST